MLPDTQYLLCRNPDSDNELALAIFNAMQSTNDPYNLSANPDGTLLLDDEE